MKYISTGTIMVGAEPLKLTEIVKTMDDIIKAAVARSEWTVIDPNGAVYQGKVDDLLPVLIKHHSMLVMPSPEAHGKQS